MYMIQAWCIPSIPPTFRLNASALFSQDFVFRVLLHFNQEASTQSKSFSIIYYCLDHLSVGPVVSSIEIN